METKELTKILLSSIEAELQTWAEESQHINNGYDYETKFTERVRAINQILLQKSVEMKGKGREKKSSHQLWNNTRE